MTAFANHFAFEFKTGLRNPSSLLLNYLFPLAFYALMGLVMTQINPLFKQTMIPAMAIFATLAAAVLGLPTPLVESREAGIFRSFKINGVPALSILSIPMLTTIIHVLIVAALITVTGPVLFNGAAPSNWPAFVLITLLMVFSCAAIGALIGVVASSSRAIVLYSQLIFLPSMLIGGLMMPVDMLPASIRPISGLLPSTHAMQAYLGLAYGQPTAMDAGTSVAILLVGGLLAFCLANYLFNWDSSNGSRRGHPALALLALAPYVAGMLLG